MRRPVVAWRARRTSRGRRNCGSSVLARSIGPATSWGKNATKAKNADQVARRLDLAAVDVDRVAERLERVEGDADGQRDPQGGGVHLEAQRRQEFREGRGEEVEVLEEPEEAQVHGEADPQEQAPSSPVLRPPEPESDDVVDDRAEHDQREEAPIPPSVEEVARGEDQQVLGTKRPLRERPVDGEHERQEDGVDDGVELHGRPRSPRTYGRGGPRQAPRPRTQP